MPWSQVYSLESLTLYLLNKREQVFYFYLSLFISKIDIMQKPITESSHEELMELTNMPGTWQARDQHCLVVVAVVVVVKLWHDILLMASKWYSLKFFQALEIFI